MATRFKKKLAARIEWELNLNDKTDPTLCRACLLEQNKPGIPLHKRKVVKYPCEKHGDPTNPPPEIVVSLWLYSFMPIGGSFRVVDVMTLKSLLKMIGVKKSQTLFYVEMLKEIENALVEYAPIKDSK